MAYATSALTGRDLSFIESTTVAKPSLFTRLINALIAARAMSCASPNTSITVSMAATRRASPGMTGPCKARSGSVVINFISVAVREPV